MNKSRNEVVANIISNWTGLQLDVNYNPLTQDRDLDAQMAKDIEGCMDQYSTCSIQAFTHWLYYADSNFIKKAWAGNEWMGKHLQDKLDGFIKRDPQGIMGLETLIKWHQELDTTNQAILYKYIMDNHLNKWR
jgi:hypothetical protein